MGCTWQRNLACVITVSLLITCLLVSVIIYLLPHCHCVSGKNSTQACDSGERGCNTKPIVLTDVVVVETKASHTNFSQAWSNAEEKARRPAHAYVEKQHAVAIYMYTKSMLKHSNKKVHTVNVDISNKQVRFGSFTLASDKRSLERSCTCFQVNTCFGADVSHYSALETNYQVLIPPYEVFKVSRVHLDVTEDCNITYKLESNLNCVYDAKRKILHPISASSAEGLWCIVIVTFVITIWLVVALIFVKAYRKKTHRHSVSYVQPVTRYHA